MSVICGNISVRQICLQYLLIKQAAAKKEVGERAALCYSIWSMKLETTCVDAVLSLQLLPHKYKLPLKILKICFIVRIAASSIFWDVLWCYWRLLETCYSSPWVMGTAMAASFPAASVTAGDVHISFVCQAATGWLVVIAGSKANYDIKNQTRL